MVSVVADEMVKLDVFSLSEVKMLLEKSVTQIDRTDNGLLTELLQELMYLPLAITQAAAYLERNKILFTKYLRLL